MGGVQTGAKRAGWRLPSTKHQASTKHRKAPGGTAASSQSLLNQVGGGRRTLSDWCLTICLHSTVYPASQPACYPACPPAPAWLSLAPSATRATLLGEQVRYLLSFPPTTHNRGTLLDRDWQTCRPGQAPLGRWSGTWDLGLGTRAWDWGLGGRCPWAVVWCLGRTRCLVRAMRCDATGWLLSAALAPAPRTCCTLHLSLSLDLGPGAGVSPASQ